MAEYESDFPGLISEYVEAQLRRNNAAVETVYERMLTQEGTDYGVLVENNADGTVTVTLSPSVPFGQIHYQESPGAGHVGLHTKQREGE
jgi:hypothetical protein